MQETKHEYPLLLSQPMVLAVIDRRIDRIIAPVKFNYKYASDSPNYECRYATFDGVKGWIFWSHPPSAEMLQRYHNQGYVSPWGYKGDTIWVKEGYAIHNGTWYYRADVESAYSFVWDEAKSMPYELARLFLEVRDVCPQRLHDVEGLDWARGGYPPRESKLLHEGWDRLHGHKQGGACAWDKNPWVWRLLFRMDKARSVNV